MDRNIWIERKFEFVLPAWMFPYTVERLRGGPARLEDATRGMPAAELTGRIDGRWSIQEHAGHLFDLESLWSRRLDELVEGSAHLTAWEQTNRATEEANHNMSSLETILCKFRATRMSFVQRLDALDDSDIERTALHPRLQKPMRTIDLVYFVAEHDDHHLAEIARLKRTLHCAQPK
ncbi:MAG: DinB family protein [Bdellovibrionota bacterium]